VTGQAHRTSSRSLRGKSRRGRPSKTDLRRILEQDGGHIVEMLNLHLLRQPVDPQFKPYYERVLGGDLGAIADYCDRNAAQKDLDGSFYELVGRLVGVRCYRAVNQVLLDIERRGATGWPNNRDTYEYWYKVIKPACEAARQFVRAVRKSGKSVNREGLWHEYVRQPLPAVRYAFLARKADQQLMHQDIDYSRIDEKVEPYLERIFSGGVGAKTNYEEMFQKERNERDGELRRSAVEELLEWSESHTRGSVRLRLEAIGCRGRELNLLTEPLSPRRDKQISAVRFGHARDFL